MDGEAGHRPQLAGDFLIFLANHFLSGDFPVRWTLGKMFGFSSVDFLTWMAMPENVLSWRETVLTSSISSARKRVRTEASSVSSFSSFSSAVGLGRRAYGAVPPARKRVIHLGAAKVPYSLGNSRLGAVRGPGKAGLRISSDFLRGRRRKRRTSHTVRGGGGDG